MQAILSQASSLSGVSEDDAFQIDNIKPSLYERFGHDTFVQLSTIFYTAVYADEEKWFADIFAGSAKEEAIQNQYEFFIQRMGGPPLYSKRKGHPALIGRHRPYTITVEAAKRWMYHMRNAVEQVENIKNDKEGKEALLNFLSHSAFFVQRGNEMTRRQSAQLSKENGQQSTQQ